ncbi:MAG: LD-carboxypeptidase [Lachnospiraceae bacterium]|nr:LD-carboxypeptidase [Lachnospiraceae bacterium]
MQYPEFLKKGQTLGFVSPSFSCATEPYKSAFRNSLNFWKEKGINTFEGPNTYISNGIGICNSPKLCAKELTEVYSDPEISALISCGGGELMCETISFVDFDVIKRSTPKWYMGYSDNTNFTFLLTTLCDTASIYGPCAASFGMDPLHESLTDSFEILTGRRLKVTNYKKWEKDSLKDEEHPLTGYNLTEATDIKAYLPSGSSNEDISLITSRVAEKGRLIGGCMDILVNLLGTRFDRVSDFIEKYKNDGFIWYLEACDLNVFSIRRAMWQMEEAGWFDYAKAFIFGRPYNGEEMMGLNSTDAVLPFTTVKHRVPAIIDANIGHYPPMMPLINGSMAFIDYDNGSLTIDMKLI